MFTAIVVFGASLTSKQARFNWLSLVAAILVVMVGMARPFRIWVGLRRAGPLAWAFLGWALILSARGGVLQDALLDLALLFFFALAGISISVSNDRKRLEDSLGIALFTMIAVGDVFYFLWPDFVLRMRSDGLTFEGIFAHKNNLAYAAGLAAVWAATKIDLSAIRPRYIGLWAFATANCLAGRSETGVVLLLLSLVVIVSTASSRFERRFQSEGFGWFLLLSAGGALVVLGLNNFQPLIELLNARWSIWTSGIKTINSWYGLTGVGLGIWRNGANPTVYEFLDGLPKDVYLPNGANLHSTYLDIALQLGVVGLVVWVAMVLVAIRRFDDRTLRFCLLGASLVAFVETRFPGDILVVLVFAGLASPARQRLRRPAKRSSSESSKVALRV